MVQRAEPFGLDLGTPHHVVLAAPSGDGFDVDRAALGAERVIVDAFGDRDVLVGTKDGQIVAVVPGPAEQGSGATLEVARRVQACIEQAPGAKGGWHAVAGRAFAGYFGVARSYEEARDSLRLADRLGISTNALNPGQLLVHRVIGRDQAANVDLVRTVLLPLQEARGGAQPLVQTLRAYFDRARTATETARELHVSVRTVTYRLDRVRQLTGYDPTDAQDGFVLQAAVHGALLLAWPVEPLPAAP
jgi:sugar diacid utilization regulator